MFGILLTIMAAFQVLGRFEMTKLRNRILDCLEQSGDLFVAKILDAPSSKEELLDVLKISLLFPEGHGKNWDSLDDSITDLSWLKQKNVLLTHSMFPNLVERDFGIYMQILKDAVEFWQSDGRKNLFVTFGI